MQGRFCAKCGSAVAAPAGPAGPGPTPGPGVGGGGYAQPQPAAPKSQLPQTFLRANTTGRDHHEPEARRDSTPRRADILPAGTLILREAMEFLHIDSVRVSTHGLRYGIALREAQRAFPGNDFKLVE